MSSDAFADRRTLSCPPTLNERDGGEGSSSSDQHSVFTSNQGSSEVNKAKVNKWVESETGDGEDDSGKKQELFHLSPNAPDMLRIPDSVGTRPQTEPGRCRDKAGMTGLVKAPKSVHDVTVRASAGGETATKQDTEDWVLVEKPPAGTADGPESETRTLVTSLQEPSSDAKDDASASTSTQGTRVVTSNKFGSTFELVARPKAATKKPETTKAAPSSDQGSGRGGVSLAHIGAFATAVTRFKSRRVTAVGFASLDPEVQQILKAETDNIKTEIPEAMMHTIKEEAYRIVLKTTSAYRSQIGARHKLTQEAYDYIKELREELKKP